MWLIGNLRAKFLAITRPIMTKKPKRFIKDNKRIVRYTMESVSSEHLRNASKQTYRSSIQTNKRKRLGINEDDVHLTQVLS